MFTQWQCAFCKWCLECKYNVTESLLSHIVYCILGVMELMWLNILQLHTVRGSQCIWLLTTKNEPVCEYYGTQSYTQVNLRFLHFRVVIFHLDNLKKCGCRRPKNLKVDFSSKQLNDLQVVSNHSMQKWFTDS